MINWELEEIQIIKNYIMLMRVLTTSTEVGELHWRSKSGQPAFIIEWATHIMHDTREDMQLVNVQFRLN